MTHCLVYIDDVIMVHKQNLRRTPVQTKRNFLAGHDPGRWAETEA